MLAVASRTPLAKHVGVVEPVWLCVDGVIARRIYRDLIDSWKRSGHCFWDENVFLRSDFLGHCPLWGACRVVAVLARLWTEEQTCGINCGLGCSAWELRSEFGPSLTQGCIAWQMRPEVLRAARSAMVRMARITRREFRRSDVSWLDWHKKGRHAARDQLTRT